jgi:hypothetical protein
MIIELESVEVSFNAGKESLKVLDIPRWNVREKERVAIFEPSGDPTMKRAHLTPLHRKRLCRLSKS